MSRSTRVKRGITLIEVLVASVLLLLLLGLVLRFSSSAYRITKEEFERTGLEQEMLLLVNRLNDDIALASAAGISISSSGHDVMFHPVTLSDVGTVVYQDKLFLWHLDSIDKVLTRQMAESYSARPFDGTPIRADEMTLIGLSAAPEFKLTQRYPHISEFKLTNPSDVSLPFVGSPLTLEVVGDLELARTRKQIPLTRVYQLRNSGS